MDARSEVERKIRQARIDNAIRIATIAAILIGSFLFGYFLRLIQ